MVSFIFDNLMLLLDAELCIFKYIILSILVCLEVPPYSFDDPDNNEKCDDAYDNMVHISPS